MLIKEAPAAVVFNQKKEETGRERKGRILI
jgi:hypothetical protein